MESTRDTYLFEHAIGFKKDSLGLFWENAFWKIQIFIPKIFRLKKIFGGPKKV